MPIIGKSFTEAGFKRAAAINSGNKGLNIVYEHQMVIDFIFNADAWVCIKGLEAKCPQSCMYMYIEHKS